MSNKLEIALETAIFKSRWLLAPFYVGLVLSIVLLFVKFVQEFWHIASNVVSMSESGVVIGILALVDLSLVGSLLLMVIFSGYEIFISKIDLGTHEDRPEWMGKVNFSGLKLKVIGAIVAISAIDLLKTFMNLPESLSNEHTNLIMWKVIIHLTFVVSGLIFAYMDKVAGDTKHH
ncbi:TIGR00645 family protein [Psychromonas antarctica]|uniref:TIGR00645 family protein n=1 Tax=Psychromonas antarctica TaxID=67573 RepID=UPI001EE8E9FB|nr:TIGR00645 family protein [Psychromonas antarctica]MCG6202293.1 TIGR00645 family protein [Psychromonas antarctica]